MNDSSTSSSATTVTTPSTVQSSSFLPERTDTTVSLVSISGTTESVWSESILRRTSTQLPASSSSSSIEPPSTTTDPTTTDVPITPPPSSSSSISVNIDPNLANRTPTMPLPVAPSLYPSLSSVSTSSSISTVSSTPTYHRIFLSLRFTEAKQEATLIKAILENYYNIPTFLCDIPEGEDISDAIINAIAKCELVVIFGTATYGRKTDSSCSTYQELRYVMDKKKPYFLVKMCDEFSESYADFHLTSSISYYVWKSELSSIVSNDGTVSMSVPSELIQRIITKLNNVVNGTDNTFGTSSSTGNSSNPNRTITSLSHSSTAIPHSATIMNNGSMLTVPISNPTTTITMDPLFTLTRNNSNESVISHRTGTVVLSSTNASRINSYVSDATVHSVPAIINDSTHNLPYTNGGNISPNSFVASDVTAKLSIHTPLKSQISTHTISSTPSSALPTLSKNRLAALEREEAMQEQSKRSFSQQSLTTSSSVTVDSVSSVMSTPSVKSTGTTMSALLSPLPSSVPPVTPLASSTPSASTLTEQQLRKKQTIAKTKADLLVSVCGSIDKALFESIDDKDSFVVESLCNREETNLNVTNKDGLTPLMVACSKNDTDIVKVLVSFSKLDINYRKDNDLLGPSALCYAIQNGNMNLIQELLQHPQIDVTAIELLAANGEIKKLLKNHQRNTNTTKNK